MSATRTSHPQMVFLIGAARSGTKFLRDLLAQSEAASCVPFDVNYVWRYRNETLPDDVIPPESTNPAVAEFIRRTLIGMARKSSGQSRPVVVEKTVSNVFRIPFVLRVFPDAKFVHIVRDGREVALSAARQWESPNDVNYLLDKIRYFPIQNWAYGIWYLRNALRNRFRKEKAARVWGPRYPGIDRDLATRPVDEIAAIQWSKSVIAGQEGLMLVPEEQKFSIRYEDLVSDSRHLAELVRFLELPDPQRIVESYESTVSRNKGGAWEKLSIDRQANLIRILQPGLLECGYKI